MSDELFLVEAKDRRAAARIVLRNWSGEIVALIGELRAGAWRKPADTVCLMMSPADAIAVIEADGKADTLGRFARTPAGADALATRLAEAGRLRPGFSDALLRFDDSIILRSQVKLPKVSNAALRGALRFELERLSPIPPAELYFDFTIQSHDKAANRVELMSRALRRRTVDEAAMFARGTGLHVAGIRMGGDPEPADWRQFPIDRSAMLRGLWRSWGSAALAALAIILLLATLFLVAARTAAENDALTVRIADEQMRAAAVSRLEREIGHIRSQAAFVAQRRTQTTFVAALAALTDALPDDTWLTDIQLDDGKLHIQGYSRAASSLIAKLDRSGHFSGAQFNAPLVRNDADGTERFDLTVKVAQ